MQDLGPVSPLRRLANRRQAGGLIVQTSRHLGCGCGKIQLGKAGHFRQTPPPQLEGQQINCPFHLGKGKGKGKGNLNEYMDSNFANIDCEYNVFLGSNDSNRITHHYVDYATVWVAIRFKSLRGGYYIAPPCRVGKRDG